MADGNIKKPYSDERWKTDIGNRVSFCSDCVHRNPFETKCKAFPNGIPHDVLVAKDRSKDQECARGIHKEPKKE